LLTGAAILGHKEASSMLAWAKLLGTRISISSSRSSSQDMAVAVQKFEELVITGLPSAHMVKYYFLKSKCCNKNIQFLYY
jgi:SEL1 protein